MARINKNFNNSKKYILVGVAALILIVLIALVLIERSFLKQRSTTDSNAYTSNNNFNTLNTPGSLTYKGTKSTLNLETNTTTVRTGSTFAVRAKLTQSSAHAVLLELKYDPAILSVKEINALPQFAYLSAKNINNSSGITKVLAGVKPGFNVPASSGDVVEFKFMANKATPSTSITFNESTTKTFVNGLNSLGGINNLTISITQ